MDIATVRFVAAVEWKPDLRSGAYPQANHTIAVDAYLNPFVPMGTHVIMNGVEYVVEDTGNFAQYGVQFDVFYGGHASASAHGHQTWEAYIADSKWKSGRWK